MKAHNFIRLFSFIAYLCLHLCFPVGARCETRIYEYLIQGKSTLTGQPSAKIVTTHMSPTSYLAYYGSREIQNIELIRTWACPGNTGQLRPPCLHPYEQWKMDQGVKATLAPPGVPVENSRP